MISYSVTPIHEIRIPELEAAGVRLLIKREDQNHPEISGNKWWKLKYNLAEALHQEKDTILTFGGSFSNHIYSTAAAAQLCGLKSIGIIRGEESLPMNPILSFSRSKGTHLHFLDRESYRQKTSSTQLEKLKVQFGDFYLIPEGGTNELAVKGCREFGEQLQNECDFNYLCLPVGTGGTMAGIIQGLNSRHSVIGFSVLKGGEFLEEDVRHLLQVTDKTSPVKWRIETNYHFGGYGKVTDELKTFIQCQFEKHNLPLDPVYTSKTLFGIYDLVQKQEFSKGSTILLLHTGGLPAGLSK